MSKEAMKLAHEALENWVEYFPQNVDDIDKKAIAALETALAEQPAQQEPVAHAVIAGALFDFMGWLTSRKERLVLSSADNASPAVEAITEFAKMRGLSLNDAKVQDWNTSPPAQQEPVAWPCLIAEADFSEDTVTLAMQCTDYKVSAGKHWLSNTPPAQRKPLTDEAIATVYWGATGQSLRPQDNVLAHNFARSIEAAHGIKENT